MRLADQISLRSRRRKFGLFMETMAPTAETTVLDVGVDDFAFGELSVNEGSCGTLNFFEEMYPWQGQLTAVGQHEGERFRSSYPDARYVQADALELPFEDGAFDIVFSNAVIEHVGGEERAAALRRRGAPGRPAGVHHDAEPLVPGRGAHAPAARPLAAGQPSPHRAYDLARKPWAKQNRLLGPGSFARLFPGEVRIVNLGLSLVAVVD